MYMYTMYKCIRLSINVYFHVHAQTSMLKSSGSSVVRGGWSRFSRNLIIINAHHMSSTVFADSAGYLGCGSVR